MYICVFLYMPIYKYIHIIYKSFYYTYKTLQIPWLLKKNPGEMTIYCMNC